MAEPGSLLALLDTFPHTSREAWIGVRLARGEPMVAMPTAMGANEHKPPTCRI